MINGLWSKMALLILISSFNLNLNYLIQFDLNSKHKNITSKLNQTDSFKIKIRNGSI